MLILDEDADIDVGNVYNVTTGGFEDLVASNVLCQYLPCDFGVNKTYDLTAAPNGDILISASDGYGPDLGSYTYLIRHSASGNSALARSTALYSIMEPDMGARGVAVDSAGGIIASFPAAGDYGIVITTSWSGSQQISPSLQPGFCWIPWRVTEGWPLIP